ncbi:hypothetical protein [Flavobacterium sp.]|uniref:hypothetical protein n=1 Tax=Flavobacterium sp. TaxID=239 RepID=UPI003753C2BC
MGIMKATKIQPKTTGGITPFQIKEIMRNCNYNEDIKEEWVQWVTGDVNRKSLRSITHDEAIRIMHQQTGTSPLSEGCLKGGVADNWARFDKTKPRHKVILSLCRQAQWTIANDKHGEVADLGRLSNFLKSDKSPVRKPLMEMTSIEVEKIIQALNGIVKSIYR